MRLLTGPVAAFLSAVIVAACATAAGAQGAEQMTLEKCIQLALESSPTYGQAEERVYSAGGQEGLARSELLPHLSFSSTGTQYQDSRVVDFREDIGRTEIFSDNLYDAGFSFNQSIYNGVSWNRKAAASHRVGAAREGLREARLNTVLRVKEAYYGVLRSQRLLGVAEETVEASRHRQERVDALFEVGSVAKADVLQNRVQLAQDELNLISVRNQLEIARAGLLNAMGMEITREIEVAPVVRVERAAPAPVGPLIDEARKNNAGLADLRQEVLAAGEEVDAARAARYPSLDFNWNYGWVNYELDGSDFEDHDDWTAALALRFNIFDGLATRSSIVTSQHDHERTRLRAEQAQLDLDLEVKRQHSSLIEADERIRVAEESVSSAEERVRLEDERYRLGAATLLELIEAQVDLTRARASDVEARYDYVLARARLERAVGRE